MTLHGKTWTYTVCYNLQEIAGNVFITSIAMQTSKGTDLLTETQVGKAIPFSMVLPLYTLLVALHPDTQSTDASLLSQSDRKTSWQRTL